MSTSSVLRPARCRLASGTDDTVLLLAAIEASVTIRPEDAGPFLSELLDHDDYEVREVAMEALKMAEMLDDIELDDLELDDGDEPLN